MNSREKGKRGERMLRDEFRKEGHEANRGVQYQGGKDSPDVVTDIPDVHVECKFCENAQIRKWMAQAIRDAGDKIPVVMWKKSREEWLAVMLLKDWIKMERSRHGDK